MNILKASAITGFDKRTGPMHVLVCSLIALCLPGFAQGAPRTQSKPVVSSPAMPFKLSYLGCGPVRIGMSLQQAGRALGVKLRPWGHGYYEAEGKYEGLRLYAEKRIVRFVEVTSPAFPTEQGVRVGNSVATLVKAFEELVIHCARYDEGGRDAYAAPSGKECSDRLGMDLRPEFKDKTMRFTLNAEGKVTCIRAGIASIVHLDEIDGDDTN